MKRTLFFLSALALLTGCPGGGNNNGNDAGTDDGGEDAIEPVITVAGTATVHPAAQAWMADGGLTVPSLAGVTLRVEEPLRIGLNENDPSAVFGTTVLTSSGEFSANQVDTANVIVGVGAGFRDTADAGVIRSASTIWDVTREGAKPRVNINGASAYALPKAFVDQLTTAIGPSNISSASGGVGSTLEKSGFSLIRVVDAAGNPVSGVKLKFRCGVGCVSVTGAQFFYPSDDLSTAAPHASGSTSSNGLVVYVGNNTAAHQVIIAVEGHSEYRDHAAGAAPNAGLAVTVKP